MMDVDRFLHNEENRRDIYKLLSQCYYLPDEYTSVQVAKLAEALQCIHPEIAELMVTNRTEEGIEQLQIEFSQLFVGPFKLLAPPYGSIYLESGRQVMGDSTVDARNRYREAELDFSDRIKEAPDHIAIELEFMYYLVFKEIEARTISDDDAVAHYLIKQKTFLARHLGAWVSDFADEVEKHATTDFYKTLAQVTRAFIQQDQAKLANLSFVEQSVV